MSEWVNVGDGGEEDGFDANKWMVVGEYVPTIVRVQ